MPVHFGNRKIKELYLGGRKIKEAWYGGQKVYSSVGSGVYPWHDRQDYHRGDLVHYQGLVYECIQDHQSDRNKAQPGEGWDQYSYWKQVGYVRERNDIKYDPWESSKYYYSGDIVSVMFNGEERDFKCTQRHSASVSNKPGSSGGYQYWELMSKSGSSGGSTPTPTPSQPSQPADPPSTTPAWKKGTTYRVGDVVRHNGAYYKCNFAHTTDPAWDEPGVGSIWTGYWDKVDSPNAKIYPEWTIGIHYNKGDKVTYRGRNGSQNYTAINPHYANTDNNPEGRFGSETWRRI